MFCETIVLLQKIDVESLEAFFQVDYIYKQG